MWQKQDLNALKTIIWWYAKIFQLILVVNKQIFAYLGVQEMVGSPCINGLIFKINFSKSSQSITKILRYLEEFFISAIVIVLVTK